MNINPAMSKLAFGTVKFNMPDDDKGILVALKAKFPVGTDTEVKRSEVEGRPSRVIINGPSAEAEKKIADALTAAEFKRVEVRPFEVRPFEVSPEQKRINAGLKVLELDLTG